MTISVCHLAPTPEMRELGCLKNLALRASAIQGITSSGRWWVASKPAMRMRFLYFINQEAIATSNFYGYYQ
jgi:hypothetical protein